MLTMKRHFALIGAAVAAALALAVVSAVSFSTTAQGQGASQDNKPSFVYALNKKYHDYEDGVMKVRAGGGGQIAPMTQFFPQKAEIKVGETVVWYNPTAVSEPHTVTFMNDPNSFPALDAPFVVANSSNIVPLDPKMNADPLLIPGPNGTNVALIGNARVYTPVVIANGTTQYLPLNANYTMTGTESYVNSGFIWPEGQVPPGAPPIGTFSVTFNKAGTYDYLCVIHPWMAGQVVVK
jgi:plastocyanin